MSFVLIAIHFLQKLLVHKRGGRLPLEHRVTFGLISLKCVQVLRSFLVRLANQTSGIEIRAMDVDLIDHVIRVLHIQFHQQNPL